MADKLRELAHRFRAARADGKLRLPWEKPLPYRRFSPSPGVIIITDPYEASRDPNEGRRHRDREPMSTRMRRGLQAVDEWLELPDLARKVLLKAGKIATAAVPVLGVGRVCYFELKRLREQDGSEPGLDGYDMQGHVFFPTSGGSQVRTPAPRLSRVSRTSATPSTGTRSPRTRSPPRTRPRSTMRSRRLPRNIEDTVAAMVKEHSKIKVWDRLLRNGGKDKDTSQSKGSAAGQGPEAAPKK